MVPLYTIYIGSLVPITYTCSVAPVSLCRLCGAAYYHISALCCRSDIPALWCRSHHTSSVVLFITIGLYQLCAAGHIIPALWSRSHHTGSVVPLNIISALWCRLISYISSVLPVTSYLLCGAAIYYISALWCCRSHTCSVVPVSSYQLCGTT